jgi:hypothetical protein
LQQAAIEKAAEAKPAAAVDPAISQGRELTNAIKELQLQNLQNPKPGAGVDPAIAEGRELTNAIKALTLKNLQQTPQGLDPRAQRRVDAKTKAFDSLPVVKKVQTMAEAVSFVQGMNPKTQNPADDQALIYAFAKVMDPESVVREGEYATVQKYAQQWAATLGFNAARIFSNTPFLTETARSNMKSTIKARYQATKAQYDNVRRSYGGQVNTITGQSDGETYLTDYGGAFPEETAQQVPKGLDAKTSAREKLLKRRAR